MDDRPEDWLPQEVARALLEHGHSEVARRHAADGDWHCALALALAEQADAQAALTILRPFSEHGHWAAVDMAADLLPADEAIALVKQHLNAGGPYAARRLATLVARHGRIEEMIALLTPYAGQFVFAQALVTLTAGTGHDDLVAGLLRDRMAAERHEPGSWPYQPPETAVLLAMVLERQGRVDDAVALLRGGDHQDQLTRLLLRHGREAEVRAMDGWSAACHLARWLERQGRIDEAVAVLEPLTGDWNVAAELAMLLARRNRPDAAFSVLLPITAQPHAEWVVDLLCDLLCRHGRPDEALTVLDEFAARAGGLDTGLRFRRSRVLAESGRVEEAMADMHDDPSEVARLLVEAGRLEEAVALLRSRPGSDPVRLATVLIEQGHVDEAVESFRVEAAAKRAAKAADEQAFWRRFSSPRDD
ncbi:hypothetical protein Acy02nite_74140 [Actinoplanes cyaneus]|uniref:Tetratricopeptide repeat protein n=1 Tax=Actinoplanes cyaneus TaxID=52696 RepID=A0A919M9J8_9ACTN|nr:tetratricopeptide repeat protein [Actinoplanes cyaneus]GID69533.1 hypothetical protein Acy02nite_74140 [Actinoplanes cyaneus]